MRSFVALSATVYLMCVASIAQTSTRSHFDEGKFYGGYQYISLDSHAVQDALDLQHLIDPTFPQVNFGHRQSLNGWNSGIEEDITQWFGVVVDVGGSYGTRKILISSSGGVDQSTRTKMSLYTITGGPQFTLHRGSNFQPFARVLLGGAFFRTKTDVVANNVPLTTPLSADDEGFVYGAGGGTDVFFSRRLGLRVAADFLRTSFFSDTQDQVRASAGLVFRF
jgi:hypothetical protein